MFGTSLIINNQKYIRNEYKINCVKANNLNKKMILLSFICMILNLVCFLAVETEKKTPNKKNNVQIIMIENVTASMPFKSPRPNSDITPQNRKNIILNIAIFKIPDFL